MVYIHISNGHKCVGGSVLLIDGDKFKLGYSTDSLILWLGKVNRAALIKRQLN